MLIGLEILLFLRRYQKNGYIALNIDGVVIRTCELASCGGILGDYVDKFICAFAAKIRPCSVLEDELWRIFRGWKISWSRGFRHRAMIFVHPFHDNFSDNIISLSSYRLKTMEREKGREMIRPSCEYERESCTKVVTKWLYKYHFSLGIFRCLSILPLQLICSKMCVLQLLPCPKDDR
ncbi:hypothetical protein MTR_3g026800 [Medicago truncatula]|uniref:Uncharacterized protein n=1 Tax=Medicago truncatula TaxID=3880 RepID=G7J1Q6_MEDTR|nr:hypothetical protein MTR_3g026800 [Medicago truncatula]